MPRKSNTVIIYIVKWITVGKHHFATPIHNGWLQSLYISVQKFDKVKVLIQ